MRTIQVYDPAMCCSTGVCGPDVDPTLVQMAGFLHRLEERGVKVERFGLAREPMAFVLNAVVKAALQTEGPDVLPLVFIDGELVLKGRYPDDALRDAWEKALVAGDVA